MMWYEPFTANGLLAIGASPIMSECSEDLKGPLLCMHQHCSSILEHLHLRRLVTIKRLLSLAKEYDVPLFLILWAVMQGSLPDCRWS